MAKTITANCEIVYLHLDKDLSSRPRDSNPCQDARRLREPVTAVRSSNVQLARLPTLRRKRRLLSNEPAHRRAETSRTLLSALGRPPTRATLPASRPIRRLSRTTPGSLGTSPRARVLHACELWLDGRSTVRRSGVWPAIVWDGERVPPFGSLTRRSVQFAVLDRAAGDSAAERGRVKAGAGPGSAITGRGSWTGRR